jgi:hypothetical protein
MRAKRCIGKLVESAAEPKEEAFFFILDTVAAVTPALISSEKAGHALALQQGDGTVLLGLGTVATRALCRIC